MYRRRLMACMKCLRTFPKCPWYQFCNIYMRS